MSSDPFGPSIELGKIMTSPEMENSVLKNLKSAPPHNSKMSWKMILIILIFIVTVASFILLVIKFHSAGESRQRIIDGKKITEARTPCLTFSCLQYAVEIMNRLNTSVNPCDDFSQFVCSKFQSELVQQGHTSYSTYESLNERLNKIQKKFLEGSEFKSISPVYSKAIQLYNSCVNLDTINKLGSKPLENYINKLFGKYGGWEMQFDDANSSLSKWDLMKVIEDPLIETPVFQITVDTDKENSSQNLFAVNHASLLLEKQYQQNPGKPLGKKVIERYRKYMYEIGKLLNIKKNKFNQFDEILKLDIKFSKIYPTNENLTNLENIYKMKITELQSKYCPEFNWKEIFKKRMELVKMQMNDDMDVIVYNPLYLREICKLLKYDKKTVRTIHNYVIWKSVSTKIEYLSEDFLKINDGTRRNNRRLDCVSVVKDHMGSVLTNMYVNTHFNRDSKLQVTEMINLLKAKFNENLLRNTWMDEETRSHAIKKIKHISPVIGYTESILNITYLEENFKNVEVSTEKYFQNMENLRIGSLHKMYEQLGKRPEKLTIETPLIANAHYVRRKNEILFPVAILQNPLFDRGFPRSLNYGGIGIIMGHEITHAFDQRNSNYNFKGNRSFWWTNQTRKLFNTKSSCFVKQYSRYSVHGHHINGKATLADNIADNGGMRLAYQVYKDLENKYGKEKGLPGINYTNDQLFFISYAWLKCKVKTKQSAISKIASAVHAPSQFRIIGTMSNQKEFAEAFNCPLGSPMNPRKKCILW